MADGQTRAPVEAAVLAAVYRDAEERIRLVLIRRGPRGVHGGQLALPGGRREPGDADLCATALREADEEVGLAPEAVEVLAELPLVSTVTTGFHIVPFLGRISRPERWRPCEEEIAEILEIPIDELLKPGVHGEEVRRPPGWAEPRTFPYYRIGAYQLWGATYRIVHPLLPRLVAGEWEI
jgi:8-oxo-dGTP pyrophosphatase MutT (NUDIX family)